MSPQVVSPYVVWNIIWLAHMRCCIERDLLFTYETQASCLLAPSIDCCLLLSHFLRLTEAPYHKPNPTGTAVFLSHIIAFLLPLAGFKLGTAINCFLFASAVNDYITLLK
jgi:hypothetical protein